MSTSIFRPLTYQKCRALFKCSPSSLRLKSSTGPTRQNLDREEVKKFQKLAQEWWDPNGPLKSLMSMNELRVPFIRDGLLSSGGKDNLPNQTPGKPLAGFKILDVGCGGGLLCEPLARLGACVTGVDPVEESVRVALTHALRDPDFGENLTYSCTTVEALYPDWADSFDAVVASEVIEHVPDPVEFAENCIKLIKPGGSFFVTTLNKTQLSWMLAIVAAENVLGLLPRGTHEWEKFVSPEDLTKIVERAQCRVKKVHGLWYTPFLDRWDWQESTSVNYALHAIKLR